jgi:uncharacterized membrane protein
MRKKDSDACVFESLESRLLLSFDYTLTPYGPTHVTTGYDAYVAVQDTNISNAPDEWVALAVQSQPAGWSTDWVNEWNNCVSAATPGNTSRDGVLHVAAPANASPGAYSIVVQGTANMRRLPTATT